MTPLTFFVVSFLFIYILTKSITPVSAVMLRFGQYLQLRAFPSHSENECYKFGILRIFFGAILLIRAYHIHSLLIPTEITNVVGVYSLIALVSGLFVMVGFLTQWSLLISTFLIWQFGERVMGTGTLGSDVAAMLSLLLFLTNAGSFISLDGLITNKYKRFRTALLYFEDSARAERIALAKFSALAAFWAMCTYSLSMHINEPGWTSGVVGPLLLSHNFMSSWFEFFGNLFAHSQLSIQIAQFSIWAMMCWYLAVLPFVLIGGIWRKYIIIWGVLFFTMSLVVLNLGSLAEIEFVFWAALFWSGIGIRNSDSLMVFYDDRCNLCDKTIQIITALDFFKQIELKPISTNTEALAKYNISEDKALNDLYGVTSSTQNNFYGYDFYVALARKLVLLWPLLPILYLAKVSKVGYFVYRFIAKRRRELFGICTFPRQKTIRQVPRVKNSHQPLFHSVVIHVIFLTVCYFVAIPAPYIGLHTSPTLGSQAAHYYGVTPINVFNATDIRMAENWYTLASLDFDEQVPLFTNKGSRLKMHKSDRVYFGNTLSFRRKFIGSEGCVFEKDRISLDYLSKVYLHSKKATSGNYEFIYHQYFQPLPETQQILLGVYKQALIEQKCSKTYAVNYKS